MLSCSNWFTCSLFAIVLTLSACGGKSDKPKKNEARGDKKKIDLRVPVETATIERGLIQSYISAYANLDTESNVRVIARTSDLVSEILVEEGDVVNKDNLLLTLENEEQLINLNKVSSNLEKNQSEFNRQQHLKQRNLVSDKEFANAKNTLNQSKLDKAKAQLEYDHTFVKAPINGTITERLVNLGDKVRENDHLFSIVDFNTIVARIFLPEENLAKVRVGQKALVMSQSFEDTVFEGEVLRIAPVIDSRSGTFKVTVGLASQEVLRPGMYVNVSLLVTKKPDAVLVPKKALVYDDEQIFVYKIMKGRAKRVYIEPLVKDVEFIEPEKHISEGDELVIAGQNSLKDGAKVRVINAENASGTEEDPSQTDKQKNKEDTKKVSEGDTDQSKKDQSKKDKAESKKRNGDMQRKPIDPAYIEVMERLPQETDDEYRARMKEFINSLPDEDKRRVRRALKRQRSSHQNKNL